MDTSKIDWAAVLTIVAKVIGNVGGAAFTGFMATGTWQAAAVAATASAIALLQQAPQNSTLTK